LLFSNGGEGKWKVVFPALNAASFETVKGKGKNDVKVDEMHWKKPDRMEEQAVASTKQCF
jgi:hypothetical protein